MLNGLSQQALRGAARHIDVSPQFTRPYQVPIRRGAYNEGSGARSDLLARSWRGRTSFGVEMALSARPSRRSNLFQYAVCR